MLLGLDPILIWALLTGGVTGGVWVAIVLRGRQQRLADEQLRVVEQAEQQLEDLADVGERLAELEARLEAAEYRLVERDQAKRLPP
jgi:hypothetical protein